MKKLNNKFLIGILVSLVAVWVFLWIVRSPQKKGNLKEILVQVDTTLVTKMLVYPSVEKGAEIELLRDGKKWWVKKQDQNFLADMHTVNNVLKAICELNPIRLVTQNKEKWNDYGVADTSTHIKIFKGKDMLADVYMGKIDYDQPIDGKFHPNQISSYVRLANEDEVYAVKGFLGPDNNRVYNDWRDKSFLRVNRSMITEVLYTYPLDSGFLLLKKEDNKWYIKKSNADSARVESFIKEWEIKNADFFASDFTPTAAADLTLQIKGKSGLLAKVEAWKREKDWVLKSSNQPDFYFSSKPSALFNTVFKEKKYFLRQAK